MSRPSAIDTATLGRIAAWHGFTYNMSGIVARELEAQGYVEVVFDHGGAQVGVSLTDAGRAAVDAAAQGA